MICTSRLRAVPKRGTFSKLGTFYCAGDVCCKHHSVTSEPNHFSLAGLGSKEDRSTPLGWEQASAEPTFLTFEAQPDHYCHSLQMTRGGRLSTHHSCLCCWSTGGERSADLALKTQHDSNPLRYRSGSCSEAGTFWVQGMLFVTLPSCSA